MRDVRTDGRQTREDRATQPMDAGWLSFAIASHRDSHAINLKYVSKITKHYQRV